MGNSNEAVDAQPSLYSLSLQRVYSLGWHTHTHARTHIMRSSPLACASSGMGAARSSHPRAGAPGTASSLRPLSEPRASAHHLPASFASVSPRRLQLSRERLSALHERMHSTALMRRRCHPSLRIAPTSLSSPPVTPHAPLWRWDSAASALSAFSHLSLRGPHTLE